MLSGPLRYFFNLEHKQKVWSLAPELYEANLLHNHWATQSMGTPWQYAGPIGCMTAYLEQSKTASNTRDNDGNLNGKDEVG